MNVSLNPAVWALTRPAEIGLALLLSAGVCLGAACSDTRGVVLGRVSDDSGGVGDAAADGAADVAGDGAADVMGRDAPDGSGDAAPDAAEVASYCQGEGPPLLEGGGCWAAPVFERALCACGDVTIAQALRTRMVDEDAPAPEGRASVASPARFDVGEEWMVGGALVLSEPGGVAPGGPVRVEGAMRLGGPLTAERGVEVLEEAEVAGDVQVGGDLTVVGALTQPEGASLTVGGAEQLGERRVAPVVVEPPCGCGAAAVDPAAEVARASADHDNALIGLDPDALDGVAQDTVLRLPCGRYLLSRVAGGERLIRLEIAGRVALYVEGDLELERDLAITLVGERAELDLFVAGRLISSGTLQLGDRTRPDALRIHVAGGPLELSGVLGLAGHLYAPTSDLTLTGDAEVFGSMHVRRLDMSGSLTVFFDPVAQELTCAP